MLTSPRSRRGRGAGEGSCLNQQRGPGPSVPGGPPTPGTEDLQPPRPSAPPATRRGQHPRLQTRELGLGVHQTAGGGQGTAWWHQPPGLAVARPLPSPRHALAGSHAPCHASLTLTSCPVGRTGRLIKAHDRHSVSQHCWADVPAWPSGGPCLPALAPCGPWTEVETRAQDVGKGARRSQGLPGRRNGPGGVRRPRHGAPDAAPVTAACPALSTSKPA